MCLVPGTLSREVSRPNDLARRRASWLRVATYALLVVAALRILSFSIWSAIGDGLIALYGLSMLRANFGPDAQDRVVMLESVLSYAYAVGIVGLLGIVTLILLITHTSVFQIKLSDWQIITGFVVSGIALAVYLVIFVSAFFLTRALRQTLLGSSEEGMPFVVPAAGAASSGSARSGAVFPPGTGVGRVARPVPGYDFVDSSSESARQAPKFPGKAYRLDV